MQTILGSGGAVGTALASELRKHTNKIRLVSRNPRKVHQLDELMSADLTNADQVRRAVVGSEVVYLTVGFEYKASVWESHWPRTMHNVIEACKEYGASLVFFDNVYMYDRDHLDHMTEQCPVNPSTKKGKIRAKIARELMDAVERGSIDALIARSADFIALDNSIFTELVLKKYRERKRAIWLARTDKIHTFTYVPDAARATALLGNTPDAFNQVWHLPTHRELLTGKKWMELAAEITDTKARYFVLKKWMMTVMGWFSPFMRETARMLYQFDRDYVFDSSKFEAAFNISATPPENALRELLDALEEEEN